MKANITKTKHRFGQLVLAFLLGAGISAPAALHASNLDSGVFEFQQKLAKGGNPQAQYQLATMYESGRGIAKDINKAKAWYKKSAAGGHKSASHRLTYLDIKTGGFKASHKPWFNGLVSAAKRGDSEAMYILGDMYESGTGVKKNLKQAQSYYKSSSARGNVDAESRLYSVEQRISQQQQQNSRNQEQARKQAEKQKQAEKERKARQAAAAKEKARAEQARQKRLKAEQERRKLEMERRKIAEERRKLEAQRQALEAQKAAEAEAAAQNAAAQADEAPAESNDKFESDLCKGKAARFRTQCR